MALSKEQFNFYRLIKSGYDVVTEALRDVFITEWNKKYPTTPWNNTNTSYLFAAEARVAVPRGKKWVHENITKLSSKPNIQDWDISLLTFALKGEHGVLGITPGTPLYAPIHNLQNLRNNALMHYPQFKCSDQQFEDTSEELKTNISDLRYSIQVEPYERSLNDTLNQMIFPSGAEHDRLRATLEDEIRGRKKHIQKAVRTTILVCTILAISMYLMNLYRQWDTPNEDLMLPKPPYYFSGREHEIEETAKNIRASHEQYGKWSAVKDLISTIFQFDTGAKRSSDRRVFLFSGGPGIGKTSLVQAIGHKMRKEYGYDVVFIDLTYKTDIERLMEATLQGLNGSEKFESEAKFIAYIRTHVKRRTIIILDNLEDLLVIPGEMKRFKMLIETVLNNTSNIFFLCTSRENFHLHIYSVDKTVLANLSLEDASTALMKMSKSFTFQTAEELASLCGGVPMVLAIYGAQIAGMDLKPSDVIEQIKKEGAFIAFDDKGVPDRRNIIKLIDISFDRFDIDVQEAFLAMTNFPVSFKREAAEIVFKRSVKYIWPLIHSNFLKEFSTSDSKKRFTIHPFLIEYGQMIVCKTKKRLESICFETAVSFHKANMGIMSRSASSFFSNHSENSLNEIFQEDSNLRKTFETVFEYPDIFEDFYQMLVYTSDLLIYGFDDISFSRYIEKAANFSKHQGNYKRHLALLYLEGDRGDTYFYLRKAKYDYIANLVRVETGYMANESLCGMPENSREYAMCLCSRGRAFALYASRKDWSETANSLVNITKGVNLIHNAITHFKSLNLRYEEAMAHSLLGLIQKNWKNFENATDTYLCSKDIFQKDFGDHAFTAAAYFNLGYVYMRRGPDFQQHAVDSFNQSYQIYNISLGAHRRTAYSASHAGEVLGKMERYGDAIDMLEHAYNIQKDIIYTSRDTAETLGEMANNYYKLGNFNEALFYAQRALRLMLVPGVMSHIKHRETGVVHTFVGQCHSYLGNYRQALVHFKESLVIFKFVCETKDRMCDQREVVKKNITNLQTKIDENEGFVKKTVNSITENISNLVSHYWELFLLSLQTFVQDD